ncbi:MAG TPA: hypothetical protein PLA68_01290 [Panacibacter sp.]|nr:hypothetical protein [Panacibacter sp.]
MKKIIVLPFISFLYFGCSKQSATATATANNISKNSRISELQTALTTLQFSGYTWYVKNSGNSTQGPGPNYWNKANAFVDANGWLHLKLKKSGSKWVCAEIWSQQSFGNGSYQFQVEGAIDKFDKNVVLGLFNYSGNDGFDEMDIEFARWGNRNYPNLNYTIWPAQTGYNNFSYTQEFALTGTYTTHRFTRSNDSVILKSMHGFTNTDTNLFAGAVCTSPPNSVSRLAMPVHLNLWLFQGNAPSNNKPVEIIIHSFTYTP